MKVEYMKEYIVRMRMGGLSTDSKRSKQIWEEDICMYRSHGLNPTVTKLKNNGMRGAAVYFCQTEKLGVFLFNEIIALGNFGFYDSRYDNSKPFMDKNRIKKEVLYDMENSV